MAGIVLIQSRHPMDCLVAQIFKSKFSQIGFICPSMASGSRQQLVYLIDLFGQITGPNSSPVTMNYTLDKLVKDPLISKVVVRRLKLNMNQQSQWAIAVASTLTGIKRPSFDQFIYKILGYTRNTDKILTGLDAVTIALAKIGIQLPNEYPLSPSMGNKTAIGTDNQGMGSLLSWLGSSIISGDQRMNLYMQLVNYFEPAEEIPTIEGNTEIIERQLAHLIPRYQDIIVDGFQLVLNSMRSNPDFREYMIGLINQSTAITSMRMQQFYSMLTNSCILNTRMFPMISSKYRSDVGQIDAEIQSLVQSLSTFGIEIPRNMPLPFTNTDNIDLDYCSDDHQLDESATSSSDNSQSLEVENCPVACTDNDELTNWITNISQAIELGQTPRIDLNALIELHNRTSSITIRPITGEHILNAQIVISGTPQTRQFNLRNGTSITIPLSGGQLNKLTAAEMTEIYQIISDDPDTNLNLIREQLFHSMAERV